MARIGVVDDHEMIAAGVVGSFAAVPDVEVVVAARTVDGLLARTVDLDLVILDLALGDRSAPRENVAKLRAHGIAVVVYTAGSRPGLVREVVTADVAGVIAKSESVRTLLDAVTAALRGEPVVSTRWLDGRLGGGPRVPLTPREIEVLALYAGGEKADRVAHLLGVGRETVVDHIRNIRSKYAHASRPAQTKVDLYRRAVEDGYLPAPM